MTLSMPKKRGKKKIEEMELPANIWRGLLAHRERLNWIESAKVANLTPHTMRQRVILQKCIGKTMQDLNLVATTEMYRNRNKQKA